MDVWVIEALGWPEDRYVFAVAASVEAALNCIKEAYGPPYKVEWQEPTKEDDDHYELGGRFRPVPNYSTAHTASFGITRYELAE